MEDEIKSLRTLLTHVLHASANSSPPRPPSTAYQLPLQSSQSFNERGDYAGGGRQRNRNNTLNLNYGTISNSDDTELAFATEEDIIIRPMNQHFNDIRKAEKKYPQVNGKHRDSTANNVDHEPTSDGHIVQMEMDTLELRRELQDALAGKMQAENKILA